MVAAHMRLKGTCGILRPSMSPLPTQANIDPRFIQFQGIPRNSAFTSRSARAYRMQNTLLQETGMGTGGMGPVHRAPADVHSLSWRYG